jgi:hypothetical protein
MILRWKVARTEDPPICCEPAGAGALCTWGRRSRTFPSRGEEARLCAVFEGGVLRVFGRLHLPASKPVDARFAKTNELTCCHTGGPRKNQE